MRVATYRRASTDEANQPYSLDAQQKRIDTYVPSQPGWTVVADYVERASAKDIDGRPELRRLLRDAAAGKFDVVLVVRIDRWSRSLADLLESVDLLAGHGVTFHSATEHFDTSTPMGKLLLHLLGMFAEFERSMIIDRIERGNAAKIATGVPLTSRVGYGLSVDPSDGRIVADETAIGVVRRIFDEYVHERHGARSIAQALNADGLPGPGHHGWSHDGVARILRNRTFIGELRHREDWLPGAHEPLIDIDLFNAAQEIADERADDQRAAARSRGEFVLSGTIRCGRCRGAYVGTSGTARNGSIVRYYSCGTARRWGKDRCDGPNLPAVELEGLIIEALLASYADSTLFEEAITARLAEHADRHQPLTEEFTAIQSAIRQKETVVGRYRADYEAGTLSATRYEARAAALDDELLSLRARAAELDLEINQPNLPQIPDQATLTSLIATLTDNIRTGSVPVRKALFAALVDGIDVHDSDDVRPTFRLYDPAAVRALTTQTAEESDPRAGEMATDGLRIASRREGWRTRGDNPGHRVLDRLRSTDVYVCASRAPLAATDCLLRATPHGALACQETMTTPPCRPRPVDPPPSAHPRNSPPSNS